jgi:hypothetical protein
METKAVTITMQRVYLSSTIDGYAYVDGDLYISFVNGGKYVYFCVPSSVFEGLRNASSKGAYINKKLRMFYKFEALGENVKFIFEDDDDFGNEISPKNMIASVCDPRWSW